MRDLREGQLVTWTPECRAGIVVSWNNTAVFVRYFKGGKFDDAPAATARDELVLGGQIKAAIEGPCSTKKTDPVHDETILP